MNLNKNWMRSSKTSQALTISGGSQAYWIGQEVMHSGLALRMGLWRSKFAKTDTELKIQNTK